MKLLALILEPTVTMTRKKEYRVEELKRLTG